MARWLKQSTSVDVPIGPFLDATDGVTAETALTITQPDIRLKKNGAAWAQKAAAQTLTHEENGYYEVTLDATDTNTLGLLRLAVAESGALPIWEDFLVLPANVYDALVSASDALQVHTNEITDGLIVAATFGANAINAAKLDPDVTTELQNGLATAAALTSVDGKIDTIDNFLDTEIAAILADTNELQTDWADGGRLDLILDARASQTSLNTLDDFVDTEVAAIKAKTDNLTADPADASDIAALIDALPTAAENAAALLDLSNGIETSITPRQALRLILAASAGKLSGAATTTIVVRNVGDSVDRITATVDSSGNRSAVTVNAS